jgi:hypothetical protein
MANSEPFSLGFYKQQTSPNQLSSLMLINASFVSPLSPYSIFAYLNFVIKLILDHLIWVICFELFSHLTLEIVRVALYVLYDTRGLMNGCCD